MKRLPIGLMAAALVMSIAVSLLMLFVAGVTSLIPVSAVCLFTASLMTWVPIREEHGYIFAAIKFALVSGLSLLICPGLWSYLYILMFGWYAFTRMALRRKIKEHGLTVLIRILILNVMAGIGLAAAQFIFRYDVMMYFPGVPVWAVIAIFEGGIIVYMVLYRFFTYTFDSALRNVLLPRR